MPKFLLYKLLCLGGSIILSVNIMAQLCSGSWARQIPITAECVTGQYVGQNLTGNPAGCPTNPIYTSLQTNIFTFTQPVNTFSIDFIGFDGAIQCPRMEIKLNILWIKNP